MEGIVWKKYPGMAGGGAGGAGGDPNQDFAQLGARLQREFAPFLGAEGWQSGALQAGTALLVYEMPSGLLAVPTPLELQLYEPPLYLPEAPTTPTRPSPRVGRMHARIFYTVGNSGQIRIDCDWSGSVPIVAHKSLVVYAVADRFDAESDPNYWDAQYLFSDATGGGDPGPTLLTFDAALPTQGAPITPPTTAYISRSTVDGSPAPLFIPLDPADFTSTHDRVILQVGWGAIGTTVRFYVSSIIEHDDHLELALNGFATGSATTMVDALADGDDLIVRFDDDSRDGARVDLSIGVMVGSRQPLAAPTYTYPRTTLIADARASFPVPAFGRKLRCALQWGEETGSPADASLGQYFFAFVNRSFGPLGWIDAASAREALLGDGLVVPPGTHLVTVHNRSANLLRVTPSFALAL